MSISATERAKSLETMLVLSLVCLALYSVGGSRFLVLPAIFLLGIGLFAKRFAVHLSELWLRSPMPSERSTAGY